MAGHSGVERVCRQARLPAGEVDRWLEGLLVAVEVPRRTMMAMTTHRIVHLPPGNSTSTAAHTGVCDLGIERARNHPPPVGGVYCRSESNPS